MKIESGFEGLNSTENLKSLKNGIEDVDRAVFELFDTKIGFEVESNGVKIKVPVVFGGGERFALSKRKKAIRDNNNAMILPMISIIRKKIDISPTLAGFGTPIATRDQEYFVAKRKLAFEDRDYQNIINKAGLKNQDNVSKRNFVAGDMFPGNIQDGESQASRRNGKNISYLKKGVSLQKDLNKNIHEIITIPYPEFFLAEYAVTMWSQYTDDSIVMIEHMISKFDGLTRGFAIETAGGYRHVAFVSSDLSSDDNFDDFSNDERAIRTRFTVSVPSYLLAPNTPGLDNPFRRFLSAPEIQFEYFESRTSSIKKKDENNNQDQPSKFILSDVENINPDGTKDEGREDSGIELLYESKDSNTGITTKEYRRVVHRNKRKGETVYSADYLKRIE